MQNFHCLGWERYIRWNLLGSFSIWTPNMQNMQPVARSPMS